MKGGFQNFEKEGVVGKKKSLRWNSKKSYTSLWPKSKIFGTSL